MKLTAAQKKLPPALQKAILAKHKGKKAPNKKAPKKKATHKMPDGTIMSGAKHNKNSKVVKKY